VTHTSFPVRILGRALAIALAGLGQASCAIECAFTPVRLEPIRIESKPGLSFDYCDGGGGSVHAFSVSVREARSGEQFCYLRQMKTGTLGLPKRWRYGTAIPDYGMLAACRPLEIGRTYLVEVTSSVGLGRRRFTVESSGELRAIDPSCLERIGPPQTSSAHVATKPAVALTWLCPAAERPIVWRSLES
jgi:hypothetical protein